jgi:pimeloyl-ACP methyl ester carboxylesterase
MTTKFAVIDRPVRIPAAGSMLDADLAVPANPSGLVVFAHGSGSSRRSARNKLVAHLLQQSTFATLLMDLLTPEEELVDMETRHLRFDISMLATRLAIATDWAAAQEDLAGLPLGYFGASTGAGAALVAATERPDRVRAVVSRGGRPDLAGDALRRVTAPTLMIVGGKDEVVIDLNEQAKAQMPYAVTALTVIEGATHLFEEPGTLEQVARLAADWYRVHLAKVDGPWV